MGFRSFPLLLIIITSFFLLLLIHADQPSNPRLIDHLVRDHSFQCYTNHTKTGFLYPVSLPSNISGVTAHTARYRSGSLRRYGAQIQEFHLFPGTHVRPYVHRLILVLETWDHPWSSLYNISGFRLLSPILGILAYDATNRSELDIFVDKRPISIDFTNISKTPSSNGIRPLCAYFDMHGNLSVYDPSQASLSICEGFRQGHYALLMESLMVPRKKKEEGGGDGDASEKRWKFVVGSSVVGGLLVAVLLGLLCVALVQGKKKTKIAEMERRAYELEALQIAMVGHFMAPTAGGTRTMPTIEND
ncbi:hypothetical protein MRB53_019661 [Persea americana]|uniref:Uncharacterized protein n=1 Tax=Persea americana TaxID=3435 RepID=A0ACC2KZX2_PERAE|nr:hypothetical protein MRB53_019661 [Persea americana]